MKLTIHKGKHRPRYWWLLKRLWWKKTFIRRRVTFGYGCNYNLNDDHEQDDVNKLFGIGYLWDHHKESARFGWNYQYGKIWIYAYCYLSGKRFIEQITSVPIGMTYDYNLSITDRSYIFSVVSPISGMAFSKEIPFTHDKKFGFWLGPYFGGDHTAPNEMDLRIKKV